MSSKVHMGHTARKRFGQNFLHDRYVIDQIVAAINPQPGQNLVEIGPGLAALTEPVAAQMDKMTVVELDRDLAARLREHPTLKEKLTVIEADAMRFDFSTLMGKARGRCASSATCPTTSPPRSSSTCANLPTGWRTCTSCCKRKWCCVWPPARAARPMAV